MQSFLCNQREPATKGGGVQGVRACMAMPLTRDCAHYIHLTWPLTHSCGSLMAALYWELGWEVGVVKRLMEESGINWGYFIDHNPFEPHCNCHPNNYIVLPPVSNITIPSTHLFPHLVPPIPLPHTLSHSFFPTPFLSHTSPLPPHTSSQGEGKLLAPVDFDLAFRGERFFSPYTGQGDTELFHSWVHTEYEEMGRTLGGDQSNTGVQTATTLSVSVLP